MGKKRIELEAELLTKRNQRKIKFINYFLIFFLVLFFLVLIFLFKEIFFVEIKLGPPIFLTDCASLDQADTVYLLQNDVSNGNTCFEISVNNITLDCNGYRVNYSYSGAEDYGVFINNSDYTTIKNCKIIQGADNNFLSYGIYFLNSNNGTAINNNITTLGSSSDGIRLSASNSILVKDNFVNPMGFSGDAIRFDLSYFSTVQNNSLFISSRSKGIYLDRGYFSSILDNIIAGLSNSEGIVLDLSTNNIFRNNLIFSSSNGFIGLEIKAGSFDNNFFDSKIEASGVGANETQFSSFSLGALNFTNVTLVYNKINFDSASLARFNVHWYFDALAIYNNGTIIQSVNITGKNAFGDLSFSKLTGSDGKIPRQKILSYSRFANNYIDQNNYTFEARFSDNSQNFTQSWNITENKEIMFLFNHDIKLPLVTVYDPRPIIYSTLPILLNITTDESSIAYYSLDGGMNNISLTENDSGTGFTARINSISNGNYTLNYYVRDLAGNMNNTEKINFTVSLNFSDTTPPLINIYDPDNGAIYGSLPIPVNVGTNENSTTSYSLDYGRNNVSMTANSSLTGFRANISSISNGNYVIVFYVRDLVGNKNYTESRNFSVNVQTSAGDEDDGSVNNGVAPNTASTNQSSQQTNQPLSADTLGADISGLREVVVSSNVKVIEVNNNEKIVLDVGDNKNYGVSFAIVNGNVKLVVSDGEYEIKTGGVIFVDAGKKKVYIGVKEVNQDSAKIVFGLEEAKVKKELSGENDAEKRKKVAYILGIVFIILLIFVVALILYYIMSNRKDEEDNFSDVQGIGINQNFAISSGAKSNFGY